MIQLAKERYYYIDDEGFWMIGKVIEGICLSESDSSCCRGLANYITSNRELCNSEQGDLWCYWEKGKRFFRFATEEEIVWLNRCLSEDRWIPKEELFLEPLITN